MSQKKTKSWKENRREPVAKEQTGLNAAFHRFVVANFRFEFAVLLRDLARLFRHFFMRVIQLTFLEGMEKVERVSSDNVWLVPIIAPSIGVDGVAGRLINKKRTNLYPNCKSNP